MHGDEGGKKANFVICTGSLDISGLYITPFYASIIPYGYTRLILKFKPIVKGVINPVYSKSRENNDTH